MTIVHYYLGRPAHVWIAANSRRSPARQEHKGSGRVRYGIPGKAARGFTPSVPAAAHGSTDAYSRRADNGKPAVTATSGLPPAPAGGLLARRRIAIARFGADVAAAGGIGPALAAGLDPADYPVVPGGVPQAWGTRPGLPGAMRAVPGAGGRIAPPDGNDAGMQPAVIAHRRPLTDPLTDTVRRQSFRSAGAGAGVGHMWGCRPG